MVPSFLRPRTMRRWERTTRQMFPRVPVLWYSLNFKVQYGLNSVFLMVRNRDRWVDGERNGIWLKMDVTFCCFHFWKWRWSVERAISEAIDDVLPKYRNAWFDRRVWNTFWTWWGHTTVAFTQNTLWWLLRVFTALTSLVGVDEAVGWNGGACWLSEYILSCCCRNFINVGSGFGNVDGSMKVSMQAAATRGLLLLVEPLCLATDTLTLNLLWTVLPHCWKICDQFYH